MSVLRWMKGLLVWAGYATAAGLLVAGIATRSGELHTAALAILITAGISTLFQRMNRCNLAQLRKIDESVGKVWEAGGRAERRRIEMEAKRPSLAVIRQMPRQ